MLDFIGIALDFMVYMNNSGLVIDICSKKNYYSGYMSITKNEWIVIFRSRRCILYAKT